jgi:15-cis-phytoene synthase
VSWTVEAAYERCEQITTREAKNFAFGIRLLPPPKRRAMSALYALARRIDDIGDGKAPAEEKLGGLAAVRQSLADLASSHLDGEDPVLVALADAVKRYPIPLPAFDELIEGCEMDCRGVTYETFEDLTSTAVAWRAPSGASPSACSGPTGPRWRSHSQTSSASRCR